MAGAGHIPPAANSRRRHAFALLLLIAIVPICSSELSPSDRSAVTGLAELLKWRTVPAANSSDPCSWRPYVACSGGSSVAGIFLSGVNVGNVSVHLFSYLCRLTDLRSLDLSRTSISSLHGEFTRNCTGLARLSSLNLSMNTMAGSLPDFSGFPRLVELDLSGNFFSGVIDSQFSELDQLQSLNLRNNNFYGSVPSQLGRMMALKNFLISYNRFDNAIPSQLFIYVNLTILDLRYNILSGFIPASIANLTKLETLLLSSNYFTGMLPVEIVSIKNLSRFAANVNNFEGVIPPGFSASLRVLDLSYNRLSGMIPDGLLSLPNLESVDLTYNFLRGTFPDELSSNLFRLRMSGNLLTGSIPIGIGNLTKLEYFEVSNNLLSGIIPMELRNCEKLQSLNLGGNILEGPIPSEMIKRLKSVVVLRLEKNQLSGPIPDGISQLSELSILNMSFNNLRGEIPASLFGSPLFGFSKLSLVNLNGNELGGSIPVTVQNAKQLLDLQLAHNQLTGDIPSMPDSLSISLNLSGNNFKGAIPESLMGLQKLEVLEISNNAFTGEVPVFLTRLISLTHLDLSNNHLTGNLPNFPRYVDVASSGNTNLISSQGNGFRKRMSMRLMVVIAVCVAALVILFSVLGFLFISRIYYRVEDVNSSSIEQCEPGVILQSYILTDGLYISSLDFTKALEAAYVPANFLLKSRFASYYKATMPSGKNFCVKKLDWGQKLIQVENNEKFAQVMEVFGGITNSRIMIPLAYIVTSKTALLIYEYSYKGTLFDFLHSFSANPLDWQCRYSIALGVAQGILFLHEFKEPIILLDLSSRGIMLKSITESHIADAELFKIADTFKSNGSFSRLAGSVGYTPPEYAYTMRVTMAGNVYSFGVILLELLTGKPPVVEGLELPKWVAGKSTQDGGNWDQILDTRISAASASDLNHVLSVLKVAQLCVSPSPDVRPKMKTAVRMLLNAK